MRQFTRKDFLLLGAAAAATARGSEPSASEDQNFSGRWTANIERSDFASLPTPASFVRVIDQSHLHLTISLEAVDQQGKKRTGELRFGLDGEESVNEVDGAEVVGFARRLGSHILVHTSRMLEGSKFSIDELWTLSEDGLTMTIEGGVRTGFGDEDLLVVMHKERR